MFVLHRAPPPFDDDVVDGSASSARSLSVEDRMISRVGAAKAKVIARFMIDFLDQKRLPFSILAL